MYGWAITRILIAISILVSSYFIESSTESAEQLDTYIILDLNIFFLTIFGFFLRWYFKDLRYKVFFGRHMLYKYIMF